MKDKKTDIVYNGDVQLKFSYKIDSCNYHNNGLPALFKLVSKCLCGQNVGGEKPSYIDLRCQEPGTNTWTSILSSKQSLSQLSFEVIGSSWATKAVSTIPYSVITTNLFTDTYHQNYRLYLASDVTDLAFIDVNKNDVKKILPGTQAIVEWVLKLSNAM